MFYLLDHPTEKEFQALARRYREMKPLAIKTAVTMLRTGSELITGFEKLMARYGLERDGLIRRIPHKTDRRRQEINLTAGGRELLEGILPDYLSRLDTLMQGLDEEEQQTMITLLTKVAKGIPALAEETGP